MWSTTDRVETLILPVSGSSVEAANILVGDTYTTTQAVTTLVPIEGGQITLPVGPETLFLRVEKGNP